MQLPTIEMPRAEARARFEDYRRQVRDRHVAEDKAIADGYKALANGTPLIRLTEAMQLGGVTTLDIHNSVRGDFKVTVPQLAVCRADQPFAWTNGVQDNGALTIAGKRTHHVRNVRDVMRWPARSFPRLADTETLWGAWGSDYRLNAMVPVVPPPLRHRLNAMVPVVPPPLRPKIHLRNFLVLWEAEWRIAPGPPPGDPALLKQIGGDLYAVLAVWDLTPLEQAVLSGRPLPE